LSQKNKIAIAGGGILGVSVGIALLSKDPKLEVVVLEKESGLGWHASGRNSGVLHAGFYYSPDSLKAKFCKEGNAHLLHYIRKYDVPYKNVGKVVIAKSDSESVILEELYKRGISNGVELEILNKSELKKIEPLAKSSRDFLWSPTTGISDPQLVLKALVTEFDALGGKIEFNSAITFNKNLEVNGVPYNCDHLINSAGVHSLELAQHMGFGSKYRVMPFLGTYRKIDQTDLPLQRLVYPVPHPVNPFLGVHFTLTIKGEVKIGPTAIPIFGKEQYEVFSKFTNKDLILFLENLYAIARGNKHKLTSIAISEYPNLIEKTLVRRASLLVPSAKNINGWEKKQPGIRAQLLDKNSGELVQDFIYEGDDKSTHILNAVSPGWTAALPFADYIVSKII